VKTGDDSDAISDHLIEDSVGKSSQECSARLPVDYWKALRVFGDDLKQAPDFSLKLIA
jgi:hypothetical protein